MNLIDGHFVSYVLWRPSDATYDSHVRYIIFKCNGREAWVLIKKSHTAVRLKTYKGLQSWASYNKYFRIMHQDLISESEMIAYTQLWTHLLAFIPHIIVLPESDNCITCYELFHGISCLIHILFYNKSFDTEKWWNCAYKRLQCCREIKIYKYPTIAVFWFEGQAFVSSVIN